MDFLGILKRRGLKKKKEKKSNIFNKNEKRGLTKRKECDIISWRTEEARNLPVWRNWQTPGT